MLYYIHFVHGKPITVRAIDSTQAELKENIAFWNSDPWYVYKGYSFREIPQACVRKLFPNTKWDSWKTLPWPKD